MTGAQKADYSVEWRVVHWAGNLAALLAEKRAESKGMHLVDQSAETKVVPSAVHWAVPKADCSVAPKVGHLDGNLVVGSAGWKDESSVVSTAVLKDSCWVEHWALTRAVSRVAHLALSMAVHLACWWAGLKVGKTAA